MKNIDRKTKPSWVIHLVKNGLPCACCGKVEYPYIPGCCDCHTHGMDKFDHLEFQVTANYDEETIGYILNELGFRVRAGQKFKAGDLVDGIFTDCPVRLDEFRDDFGAILLRVIIPDKNNRWPEDPTCDNAHKLQRLPLAMMKANIPHVKIHQ